MKTNVAMFTRQVIQTHVVGVLNIIYNTYDTYDSMVHDTSNYKSYFRLLVAYSWAGRLAQVPAPILRFVIEAGKATIFHWNPIILIMVNNG